jgi:hypothetical protein
MCSVLLCYGCCTRQRVDDDYLFSFSFFPFTHSLLFTMPGIGAAASRLFTCYARTNGWYEVDAGEWGMCVCVFSALIAFGCLSALCVHTILHLYAAASHRRLVPLLFSPDLIR